MTSSRKHCFIRHACRRIATKKINIFEECEIWENESGSIEENKSVDKLYTTHGSINLVEADLHRGICSLFDLVTQITIN